MCTAAGLCVSACDGVEPNNTMAITTTIQAIEGLRTEFKLFHRAYPLVLWVAGPLVNCANITSQIARTQKLAASYLDAVFWIWAQAPSSDEWRHVAGAPIFVVKLSPSADHRDMSRWWLIPVVFSARRSFKFAKCSQALPRLHIGPRLAYVRRVHWPI